MLYFAAKNLFSISFSYYFRKRNRKYPSMWSKRSLKMPFDRVKSVLFSNQLPQRSRRLIFVFIIFELSHIGITSIQIGFLFEEFEATRFVSFRVCSQWIQKTKTWKIKQTLRWICAIDWFSYMKWSRNSKIRKLYGEFNAR